MFLALPLKIVNLKSFGKICFLTYLNFASKFSCCNSYFCRQCGATDRALAYYLKGYDFNACIGRHVVVLLQIVQCILLFCASKPN